MNLKSRIVSLGLIVVIISIGTSMADNSTMTEDTEMAEEVGEMDENSEINEYNAKVEDEPKYDVNLLNDLVNKINECLEPEDDQEIVNLKRYLKTLKPGHIWSKIMPDREHIRKRNIDDNENEQVDNENKEDYDANEEDYDINVESLNNLIHRLDQCFKPDTTNEKNESDARLRRDLVSPRDDFFTKRIMQKRGHIWKRFDQNQSGIIID